MAEDWLDGLSEEWPSQPPSEASVAIAQSARSSRSRIPHLRSSLGTYPSVKAKAPSDPRRRSILSERSSNVQSPGTTRSSEKRPQRTQLPRSVSGSSTASALPNGTTQVRKSASASPPKPGQSNEIPEWKRRLVQGRVGYDEQVDLFSPMGLEKMFARPTANAATSASQESRQRSFLTKLRGAPPSSPPIFNTTRDNTIADDLLENNTLASVDESLEQVDGQLHTAKDGHEPELQSEHPGRHLAEGARQPSSQSGESSEFSPVFISKHHDAKGSIKYAALDMSKTQLEEQIQRHRESLQQSQRASSELAPAVHVEEPPSESIDSLPDGLPTGTPEALPLGSFVNVRRGGLSAEGSFRRRPLSPSPLSLPPTVEDEDEDDNAHEDEDADDGAWDAPSLAGEGDVTIEDTEFGLRPPAPTPPASGTPNHVKQARYRVSGDSVRNPEMNLAGEPLGHLDDRTQNEPRITEGAVQPRVEAVAARPFRESRFGSGQLDEYAFQEDSMLSNPPSEEDIGQLRSRSPSPNYMPPGAKEPLKFRVGSLSSEVHDTFKHKRKPSKLSNRSGSLTVSKRSANSTRRGLVQQELPKLTIDVGSVSHVSEGKRPLTPFYDPTPKRRRTLVFATEDEEIPPRSAVSIDHSHERMQSVIGRKRKDARHSNISNQADADTLAKRHILRPRNPTPSQRRQEQIEKEILEATQDYLASSPHLQSIRDHLRPPPTNMLDDEPESSRLTVEEEQARAVAEEVAAFTVRVAEAKKDEGRKRSVTTQDFLDEAMKIMEFIRTKRPTSALSSLEESDEDKHNALDEEQDEGLELPSSPHTERNGWRQRQVAQLDSSVVNHLRQFEDNDDPFVASSWSIHQGHQTEPFVPVMEDLPESDPPGIRIIEPTESQKQQSKKQSKDEHPSKGSSVPSHKSHPSVDSSLGRTTMTTASRKSEKVATIAPSNVAHLIGKEVNGMHFDQHKQVWVRSKSLSPSKEKVQRDISGMTGSEDDPFGEIPDLTVDEEVEMERVSASPSRPVTATSAQWMEKQFRISQADRKLQAAQVATESSGVVGVEKTEAISTLNSKKSQSAPTNHRQTSDSSIQKAATSEEQTEEQTPKSPHKDEDADHEYSIHEGRSSPKKPQSARRVSHIHLSVSSPAASRPVQDSESLRRKPSTAYRNRELPALPSKHDTVQHFAIQALEPVTEHHEISIVDYGADRRKVNFSIALSAPLAVTTNADQAVAVAPSSPIAVDNTYATLLLSELDDFSINQPDELQNPSREIVKQASGTLVQSEESRFEGGNTALVKALQDVQSEEPFWEELRQVDLPGRNLTSLHLLDALCDQVESINVADNAINQVVGAPLSVRTLDIRNNLLTSLTTWNHLINLQYLDVSGNDIDSLEPFSHLVHLRELKADDNRIEGLEGVTHLDGLLSLSLKRNHIQTVDFESCNLIRLGSLSLDGNQLGEGSGVRNLDQLPSLHNLNLDDNSLAAFAPNYQEACSAITSLSLRGNRLDSVKLDAGKWPALRHLHLDDNRLSSFADIWTLALDSLSAQRQQPPLGQSVHPHILHDLKQVRSVALSGSHIPQFTLPSDGLPYLTSLDLARCGVQQLPPDFGRQVPSIVHLNLGGNSLSDVTPLLGLKGLETLVLANNRLSRLRKSIAVLERIGKRLRTLDLRGNAVVNGFYDMQACTAVARSESQQQDSRLAKVESLVDRLEKPSCDLARRSLVHLAQGHGGEEPYITSPQDHATDALYLSRLDNDTLMRRRVYEIMLSTALPSLQHCDGLAFAKDEVQKKDELWQRLERLGVIKKRSWQ